MIGNSERVQLYKDREAMLNGNCQHREFGGIYVGFDGRPHRIINRYCPCCGEYLDKDDV